MLCFVWLMSRCWRVLFLSVVMCCIVVVVVMIGVRLSGCRVMSL